MHNYEKWIMNYSLPSVLDYELQIKNKLQITNCA